MIIAHSDSVGIGIASIAVTVRVAFAATALLPLLVTKAPIGIVLMYPPTTADVTFTEKVQLPLAGIVRPAGNVTVEPPATATGAPATGAPQVVLAFGTAAISTCAGNVSTSAAFSVAIVALALLKVMVTVETPPAVILPGVKALAIVGGTAPGTTTIKMALADAALLPLEVTNAPTGIVLV